jgi:probable F420-dependent oxidoreductase
MSAMKIRFAVAPQTASLTGAGVLDFAEALEASDFDGIWLSDLPVAPVLDPLLGLALAAGRTRRLRLGANVVPLGRNPFLLAKELAQLDQISEGRLLLSFVTGLGQPGERQALGLDGDARGTVLEEVLGLVRAWWAGETVTHRSARWSFTELASPGQPVQDPLEVWLGGRGPKALDRVGRVADGWLGAQLTPPETGVARRRIQDAADRAGREVDPEHFGLSIAMPTASHRPRRCARWRRVAATSTRANCCRRARTGCARSSTAASSPGSRSSWCGRQARSRRGPRSRRGWPTRSSTSRRNARRERDERAMKMPSREWTGPVTVIAVAVVLAALDVLDGSERRWGPSTRSRRRWWAGCSSCS